MVLGITNVLRLPTQVASNGVRVARNLVDHPREAIEELAEEVEELAEEGAELVGQVAHESLELIEESLGEHRRVWEDGDREHVQLEAKGITRPRAIRLRERVQRALEQVEGVRWAEVNAITGKVAVALSDPQTPVARLVSALEAVESAHGVRKDRLDVGRVRQHGDDDIGRARDVGWRRSGARTGCGQLVDRGATSVVDRQLMAGGEEMAGHRPAHHTKSNESNLF